MKGSLIGRHFHSVDEKGRLAVPAKLRVELGEPFYITRLNQNCLSAFSEEEWDKFSVKLNAIPQSDAKAQCYVRMIFSGASKCEPDKQGRILIPQQLRDEAGIDKEVVMIGASNRAEIWDKEKWDAYMLEVAGNDAIAGLADYGV